MENIINENSDVTLHENYYYSNKIFNPMSERRCPPTPRLNVEIYKYFELYIIMFTTNEFHGYRLYVYIYFIYII